MFRLAFDFVMGKRPMHRIDETGAVNFDANQERHEASTTEIPSIRFALGRGCHDDMRPMLASRNRSRFFEAWRRVWAKVETREMRAIAIPPTRKHPADGRGKVGRLSRMQRDETCIALRPEAFVDLDQSSAAGEPDRLSETVSDGSLVDERLRRAACRQGAPPLTILEPMVEFEGDSNAPSAAPNRRSSPTSERLPDLSRYLAIR